MPNFGQGVGLIHELRKLAATKEFLHRCHDRANINQRIGSGLAWLLNTHTLFDDALHAQEADAELRLNEFTDAAYATITQVVDVVFAAMTVVQFNKATHNVDQVILRKRPLALWDGEVKLAIELIATNTAKIITASIEEHVPHERTGVIDRSGIARTHLFIEFEQGLVFPFHWITVERGLDIAHVGIGIYVAEGIEYTLIGGKIHLFAVPLLLSEASNSTQQSSNRQLALAVDFHGQQVLIAGLKFKPGATAWNEFG